MKKWSELYSWQKHTIVLSLILIVGFFIIRTLTYRGYLSTIDETAWNVILNLTALAYAVYAYYLYDKEAEKVVDRFKEMGIEPPNWEGLAMYLAGNLKPFFNIWNDANISEEELRRMMKKFKQYADKTDIVMDKNRILKDIDDMEVLE